MSQLEYTPAHSSFKKGWNEFRHLSPPGRYVEPKIFSGFQNQRVKLTTVRRQPKLSTLRHLEHDESLSDVHGRPTTSFIEDSKREESFIEFSGLHWHDIGKVLSNVNNSPLIQHDPILEFGAKLRTDKSQKYLRPFQTKLYPSPSLFSMSPSATFIKSHRSTFDQNSKARFHLNPKKSNRPAENIFRSSTMYVDVSSTPWNTTGNNDGSKSTRV